MNKHKGESPQQVQFLFLRVGLPGKWFGDFCAPIVSFQAFRWGIELGQWRSEKGCIADLTNSRQNAPADSGFWGGMFSCHLIERVREEKRN